MAWGRVISFCAPLAHLQALQFERPRAIGALYARTRPGACDEEGQTSR
eukprot:CAMPEP_0197924658 /NCGR_PEP_ID=MMETSP1439-20131203/96089_1 /TAXON_ID=66791 /ORGANISM="Gonyaulax spinifera, Strain CCMP409" /LENGTH=47 /DNA_ID= /DNA_START= /DNA_END= /DNA_ORIENTATION=